MKKDRSNILKNESGIALVIAMIIALVVLMLIGGLTHMLTKGFTVNVLNRQFATAYDAANGGAEYGAGIVTSYIDRGSVSGLLATTALETTATNLVSYCSTTPLNFNLRTSDGKYDIAVTMTCLGRNAIPGQGGVLAFPPLPAVTAGGGGTWYMFLSVVAIATETTTNIVGKTEAVYRAVM